MSWRDSEYLCYSKEGKTYRVCWETRLHELTPSTTTPAARSARTLLSALCYGKHFLVPDVLTRTEEGGVAIGWRSPGRVGQGERRLDLAVGPLGAWSYRWHEARGGSIVEKHEGMLRGRPEEVVPLVEWALGDRSAPTGGEPAATGAVTPLVAATQAWVDEQRRS